MSTDIERACGNCGQTFWGPAAPTVANDVLCPECQALSGTGLALAGPNAEEFARELRHWVNEAHTEHPVDESTFWEWITGHGTDAEEQENERQLAAEESIHALIAREKSMLDALKYIQISRLEAQAEVMKWRNYILSVHIEQLRLLEQVHALREGPVKVLRKKAVGKPEPEETEERDTDPEINFVMDRQRKKAREKAMADQAVISEFLNSVRRVFNDDTLENGERAMRIRSFMDSFGKGPEDLPAIIRNFLEEMESMGGEG